MWTDALNVFLDGYDPAKDLITSTHQFSTMEIMKAIMQHTGETVGTEDLVEALSNMGYRYMRTGETEMEWLFREGKDY